MVKFLIFNIFFTFVSAVWFLYVVLEKGICWNTGLFIFSFICAHHFFFHSCSCLLFWTMHLSTFITFSTELQQFLLFLQIFIVVISMSYFFIICFILTLLSSFSNSLTFWVTDKYKCFLVFLLLLSIVSLFDMFSNFTY